VPKAGWCAARESKKAVAYKPTPELVHGVTVSNPHLATLLRAQGVFSGQGLRGDAMTLAGAMAEAKIVTDPHGAVLEVVASPTAT
jgi:hypothetical protein